MQQDKRKVFLSIIVGFLSLNGLLFSTAQATDVENARDLLAENPPTTICYIITPPVYRDKDYKALREEYHQVEMLYRDKKINEETYNIRINKINAQMHKLEQEYKDRDNKE